MLHLDLHTCVSTMDEARAFWNSMVGKRPDEWILISAATQQNGRGTWGRRWSSPLGNLYCTLSGPCRVLPEGFSREVAVAIGAAIRDEGIPVEVRGLNDLTLHGKKVCGILLEQWEQENMQMLSIGIGLNLAVAPDVPEQLTTDLMRYGCRWSIEEACQRVCQSVLMLVTGCGVWPCMARGVHEH